ncbi:hypothetical protein LguiA_033714 [Lonicera macranthoides]
MENNENELVKMISPLGEKVSRVLCCRSSGFRVENEGLREEEEVVDDDDGTAEAQKK